MSKETIYMEDGEIIMVNPDYDMDDIVRWANSDYVDE